MKFAVELDESDIRRILADYISDEFNKPIKPEDVPIEVKSKQNYKSEWEIAHIRVKFEIIKVGR